MDVVCAMMMARAYGGGKEVNGVSREVCGEWERGRELGRR